MIYLLIAIFLLACSPASNPHSEDYPCGTRAHACSYKPLMCCWNFEECSDGYCQSKPDGLAVGASPRTKQWAPSVK